MASKIVGFDSKGSNQYAVISIPPALVDGWPALLKPIDLKELQHLHPDIFQRRVPFGDVVARIESRGNQFPFLPEAQRRVIHAALGEDWRVVVDPKSCTFELEHTGGRRSRVKASVDGESMAVLTWFFQDEDLARKVFDFIALHEDPVLEHRSDLYEGKSLVTRLLAGVRPKRHKRHGVA